MTIASKTRGSLLYRSTERLPSADWVWWTTAALASTAIMCIAACLGWAVGRGFDMMVEGFYMLSYLEPQRYPTFSSFHLILSKIPAFLSNGICHYRLIEVVGRLLSAVVLAWGFLFWFGTQVRTSAALRCSSVAITILGGWVALASFPQTASYNGLAGDLTFVSAGALYAAVAANQRGWWKRNCSLFAIAGAVCAILFFVKFTSALLMIGLVITVLAAIHRNRMANTSFCLAGAAVGVLAFFLTCQSFDLWWTAFHEAVSCESLASHTVGDWLAEGRDLLLRLALKLPLLGAIIWATNFGLKQRQMSTWRWNRLLDLIISIALAVSCYWLLKTHFYSGHEASLAISLTAVTGSCLYLALQRTKRPGENVQRMMLGFASLAVLPLVASAGTNCDLIGHVASNAAPWFLFIPVSIFLLNRNTQANLIWATLLCGFVLYSTVELVDGLIFSRPLTPPLTQQTMEITSLPNMRGVLLDERSFLFLLEARTILGKGGFSPGDWILSLYDLPGLVYAVNGRSPGQAWYVAWPSQDALNAHYLEQWAREREIGARLFLALRGPTVDEVIGPAVYGVMEKYGLSLASFERIGEASDPIDTRATVFFYRYRDGAFKGGNQRFDSAASDSGMPFNRATVYGEDIYRSWGCLPMIEKPIGAKVEQSLSTAPSWSELLLP